MTADISVGFDFRAKEKYGSVPVFGSVQYRFDSLQVSGFVQYSGRKCIWVLKLEKVAGAT